MAANVPEHLGRFEILGLLGRGAMGEVYLARDPGLHREVAIKTIRPDLAAMEGDAVARFEREARSAAQLKHPNVVSVFEFGREGELLYLVQERVEGLPLSAHLAEGTLQRAELLEVIAQVCEGLQHAHARGIIHRDIKPSNIMVSRAEGRLEAKVLDFGVAKMGGADMTSTGQVVGTLGYTAPEYLKEGRASAASDQFAVGVVLFEALAGERPFTGGTTGAVVYNIIHEAPRALDLDCLEGLSPALQGVVARALAKDPAHRHPSLQALAEALRSAKDPDWRPAEDPTTALDRRFAATVPRSQAGTPAAPRRTGLWVGLAGLGLAACAAGLWALRTAAPKAPQVQPTTAANVHINDAVLAEAEALLDKRPKDARKLVMAVLENSPKEGPVDPDAFALLLVCDYRGGDLVRFGEALGESRDRGLHTKDLLTNRAFKAMLEGDRKARKLPEELRNRLLSGQDE